jgi:hypothetical protein
MMFLGSGGWRMNERGCGFNLFDVFYVREKEKERVFVCFFWAKLRERKNERDAYIRESIYHH